MSNKSMFQNNETINKKELVKIDELYFVFRFWCFKTTYNDF